MRPPVAPSLETYLEMAMEADIKDDQYLAAVLHTVVAASMMGREKELVDLVSAFARKMQGDLTAYERWIQNG